MGSVQAVLFDLDGTILDRLSSLRVYLFRQAERLPDVFKTVPFEAYFEAFIELDDNGYRERADVFASIGTAFSLPPETVEALIDDYRTHFPHTCVPFPKAHQTLGVLRGQGLRMGLITNGRVAAQQPKIEGLGITSFFDAILISEVEGVRKPDPEIFRRALHGLKAPPGEAVMVGDHPEADIGGAKAFGIKAIWKRDEYWEPPRVVDAVIDELDQLPAVIRALA